MLGPKATGASIQKMLPSLLALVAWTLCIEIWLYATRLPAIRAAKIDPGLLKRKDELDVLPLRVKHPERLGAQRPSRTSRRPMSVRQCR